MRLRGISKGRIVLGVLLTVLITNLLAACGGVHVGPDRLPATVLAQIKPGETVYIDAWKEHFLEGNRAEVQRTPSGLWRLNLNESFQTERDAKYDVEVTLDAKRGSFVILDMGTTPVGRTTRDCLTTARSVKESYVLMDDTSLAYEPDTDFGAPLDNDECTEGTEGGSASGSDSPTSQTPSP